MVQDVASISIDLGTTQVIDDAVPQDIYDELIALVPRIGWQYGWATRELSARSWHHHLAGSPKANTQDVSERLRQHRLDVFARYVDWLRTAVVPVESRLLHLHFAGHTFGTDNAPRADTERVGEMTFVLHLTRQWKPEFGGETVVFDAAGDIEKAVLPRENRLLSFPSERVHAPRPLSKLFGGLRVVLIARFGLGALAHGATEGMVN